jgi:hypothetical protein
VIEAVNPYTPGKPVEDERKFFGREEIISWALRQLLAGQRVLVLYGPEQIGKTSLLIQLRPYLANQFCSVLIKLRGLEATGLNPILEHLAADIAEALQEETRLTISPPAISGYSPEQALAALETFLGDAARYLEGRSLLLMLDDFDALPGGGKADVSQEFVGGLAHLAARLPSLHFIITTTAAEEEGHFRPLLFYEVSYRRIGALATEEATKLITTPVSDVLRFDHGVIKRITELTSNHPYYLQLFCFVLFNRCARAGWVNMKQVDDALDELLALPIQSFNTAWQESTLPERAILAVLGALRGTGGIVTRQDVLAFLVKEVGRIPQEPVFATLERLADRGILARMGALSYRFHVDLFRLWLNRHSEVGQYAQGIHTPITEPPPPPEPIAEDEEAGPEVKSGGGWWRCAIPAAASLIVATALVAIGAWRLLTAQPPPEPTPTRHPATPLAPAPTSTPIPQPTPTPTPPVVFVRSLPSIVYMVQETVGANRQIEVRDSDGSNPQRLTNTQFDESWPTWSPDGKKIAFVSNRDGNLEIYVMPAPGQQSGEAEAVNLTRNPANDTGPAWSPDGKKIAFASRREGGSWELFVMNADGTDVRQLTADSNSMSPSWSPDGSRIAFASKMSGNWEIYTMKADGTDVSRLTVNEADDISPAWSPAGDYIAFESRRDGLSDIYIMRTNGAQQTRLSASSTSDDHSPTWLPDGQNIVFYSNREGNWELYVTDIAGDKVVNLTQTEQLNEEGPVWRP